MKKEYIITLCVSFIVLTTIVIIALLILLPQQTTVITSNIDEYSSITESDYTYKQTNSLTFDDLIKDYSISEDEMKKFKWTGKYVPGNSDPFSVRTNDTYGNSNTNDNNTNNSNSNSNTTVDKITNSNDGVANPNSTSK